MNKELIASLALFKTLYKSKMGNVLSIVALYIVSIMRKEKQKDAFQTNEIKELLACSYNIKIPSAIIQKTCIDNQTIFKFTKKGYSLQKNIQEAEYDHFEQDIDECSKKCEDLITNFYSYVAKERNCAINGLEDKSVLRESFLDYIKDKDLIDTDSPTNKLISQFIIENDDNVDFISLLDNIREGLIIYDGMRYADPTNEHTWKTETTFVLDAQYLFSSYGFNSNYHKECFDDFYRLVRLINEGVPYKMGRKQRISLCYFPETKDLINKFFGAAIRIKLGKERLAPDNEAMVKIVNQSGDEYSVKLLKHKFWDFIQTLGIRECETPDLFQNKEFLFETEDLNKLLEDQFSEEESEQARDLFKFADYINIWRKGRTVPRWEDCGYVFLSDGSLPNKVSKFLKKNDKQATTPVFIKMGWFTQKLWFASNQPVLESSSIVSFSVLNRAKSIVSSLCKESVSKAYKEFLLGNNTNGALEEFYQELRNEDYAFENVDKSNVREKISLSEKDALQVFIDAKKRREENDKKQKNAIIDLEKKLSQQEKAKKYDDEFNIKYGLWFNHFFEVTLFIAVIMILIGVLLYINNCIIFSIVIFSLACLLIVSNKIPIITNYRNNLKNKLKENIKYRESLKSYNEL